MQSQADQIQYGGQLGRSTLPVDDSVVVWDQVRRLQPRSSGASGAATGGRRGAGVHEGSDHLGTKRSDVPPPSLRDASEWKLAVGGVRRGSGGRRSRRIWGGPVWAGVQPRGVRLPGGGGVLGERGAQCSANGEGPSEEQLRGEPAEPTPRLRAQRWDVGFLGPGPAAGQHRHWSAGGPHPSVGAGRDGGGALGGLRGSEDRGPEPAVVGPGGAVRPPQLWVRGGETNRQALGANQEAGELPGECSRMRRANRKTLGQRSSSSFPL